MISFDNASKQIRSNSDLRIRSKIKNLYNKIYFFRDFFFNKKFSSLKKKNSSMKNFIFILLF